MTNNLIPSPPKQATIILNDSDIKLQIQYPEYIPEYWECREGRRTIKESEVEEFIANLGEPD